MWTVVIVVVLPLSQLLVEQVDVIRDAVPVEELVELLVVDAVRPFDFAVQVRRPGLDVGVTDVEALQVPVELRLELGAVIGLHDVDPKRQTPPHVVDESDRHALVARVVNLEDANPSAIIDRGELVQPLARPRNALEEPSRPAAVGGRGAVSRSVASVSGVAGASGWPAACSTHVGPECGARTTAPRRPGEIASDSRRSCQGRNGRSGAGTGSC